MKFLKNRLSFFMVVALFAGAAFVSSNAFAECNSAGCNGKIKRLYLREMGEVSIQPDGNIIKTLCTPKEGKYIQLLQSHTLFKENYAAILGAYLSGGWVSIRTNDDSTTCRLRYIVLGQP